MPWLVRGSLFLVNFIEDLSVLPTDRTLSVCLSPSCFLFAVPNWMGLVGTTYLFRSWMRYCVLNIFVCS